MLLDAPIVGTNNEGPGGYLPRDPEDRVIDKLSREARKEKMMDKTIADSFPASDPPSSLPDPEEDSFTLPPPQ